MSTNSNGNNEKSINDNISAAAPTTMANNNGGGTSVPNRKKSLKKTPKNGQQQNVSYEQNLERWLENASKMNNFDYNNLDGNWPIMNASNGATNRKGNNHLHHLQYDPISLPPPPHMNLDSSPSISAFMNFNSSFRQQYPHLLAQRQQSASPTSNNDPLTSLSSTQPDFFSLPSFGPAKVADQEKQLNDVMSQSKRFNDLLIDDTPQDDGSSGAMNALSSSARVPNESSAEDELDDEGHTDEEQPQQQKLANGANAGDGKANILQTLLKQIHLLHETNSKLFRSLHETKVEMEALKYAPSWGLRHRRDSVSGLSVHSQPFGHHYPGGIASPAPTYHSQGGSYTPGIVTDLIREVRDAGRIRDESLMNRVKALIEEKSWSHNETNMRVLRELEEVKVHLHNLKLDRQTTNDRLTKLEDDVRSIRAFLSVNNSFQQQQQPLQYSQYATSNSNLAMNDQMKRSNMSLNYGVISTNASGVDGFQFDDHQNFNLRHRPSQSPPKRHDNSLNETDEESFDKSHVIQMEKDTVKLRRDLQDALASKKHAESRIIALEHMVTSLKTPPSQTTNMPQHVSINNNNAYKNSLQSEFHQPQQHQLQIQINGGESKIQQQQQQRKSGDGQLVGKLVSPPKGVKATQVTLSAAGPITDL